jgi:hypothetical protein
VLTGADLGRNTAGNAERQPDSGEQDDEDEVIAGGGKGVQVLGADKDHQEERDDHAPAVELPLPALPEHEKHERRVEEILRSSHAAILRRTHPGVVGAEVETRVDPHLNPHDKRTPLPCGCCSYVKADSVLRVV